MALGRIWRSAALAVGLGGCSGAAIDDFAGKTPEFRIEHWFQGKTSAWGLFEDRFGTVRRQFTVDIEGRFDGKALTLDENFLYDDGERERRLWTIMAGDDGHYSGKADGVVGVAEGRGAGNAFNWRYEFDLKVGDGTWRVAFDDWLYLQPGNVVINRARVSRFGIEIGQVTLFFSKPGGPQTAAAQ